MEHISIFLYEDRNGYGFFIVFKNDGCIVKKVMEWNIVSAGDLLRGRLRETWRTTEKKRSRIA